MGGRPRRYTYERGNEMYPTIVTTCDYCGCDLGRDVEVEPTGRQEVMCKHCEYEPYNGYNRERGYCRNERG